ncbi:MAG: ribosome biogenesis factor YjgA [Deltaproteobacteria bacterium]
MNDQSYTLSRSEQKRRARNLEKLAHELSELSSSDIRHLPCDTVLKQEISDVRGLKAGARKRQLKYLAKTLRQMDAEPLFTYLAKRKGSKLQEKKEFKRIERLRDDILNDAILAFQEAEEQDEGEEVPRPVWSSGALNEALTGLPNLDEHELRGLAERYARTRKPAHSRELFRILRAAQERLQYQKQREKT